VSCVLALSLVPSLGLADEPSLVEWAQRRVDAGIVKRLAEREVSRFSRERPPPRERRIRVTQAEPTRDKRGGSFLAFAIDVRFGGEWQKDDIVGCVYAGSGDLFVKRGDRYRPAAFLFGKRADPVVGVCEPAPASARS
jgi:hypothetical protein